MNLQPMVSGYSLVLSVMVFDELFVMQLSDRAEEEQITQLSTGRAAMWAKWKDK